MKLKLWFKNKNLDKIYNSFYMLIIIIERMYFQIQKRIVSYIHTSIWYNLRIKYDPSFYNYKFEFYH